MVVRLVSDCVPEVALVPDQHPLALQEVAFVLDHIRVDELPLVTLVGEAEIVTVGDGVGGGGVPPPPLPYS